MFVLSPHFSLEELTKTDVVDYAQRNFHLAAQEPILSSLKKTASLMEWVRHVLGDRPLRITSGYRFPELNKAVNGSPTSQHMKGEACDFLTGDLNNDVCMDAKDIKLAVKKLAVEAMAHGVKFGQLIAEYKMGCVHISTGAKCQVASGVFNAKTGKWDLVDFTPEELKAS